MRTAKGRFVAALLLALVAFGCADGAAPAQTAAIPSPSPEARRRAPRQAWRELILAWQNKFHIELQTAAKALKTSRLRLLDAGGGELRLWRVPRRGPGPRQGRAGLLYDRQRNRAAARPDPRGAGRPAAGLRRDSLGRSGGGAARRHRDANEKRGEYDRTRELRRHRAARSAASFGRKAGLFSRRCGRRRKSSRAAAAFIARPWTIPRMCTRPSCGHLHAVDPTTLERDFSWSGALGAVVAAGLRPCSGAILILVFTLAQGMFLGRRERRSADVGRHGHHDRISGRLRGVRAANSAAMERSRSALDARSPGAEPNCWRRRSSWDWAWRCSSARALTPEPDPPHSLPRRGAKVFRAVAVCFDAYAIIHK